MWATTQIGGLDILLSPKVNCNQNPIPSRPDYSLSWCDEDIPSIFSQVTGRFFLHLVLEDEQLHLVLGSNDYVFGEV